MNDCNIPSGRSIVARADVPFGRAMLVSARWDSPIERLGRAADHHLQLCATASDSRTCYPEVWGRSRFEPMGTLFFAPAGHLVHSRSDCTEQQAIVCNFSDGALERWFEARFDWTSARLESCLDIGHAEIRHLLMRIAGELRSPGFASATLIELMAGQLAIELSRHLYGIEERVRAGGLAPWRLRLIDDYLRESLADASLAVLAQQCRLSVRQLSRAFRISRGRSIGAYIAELRIQRAQQLLAAGQPIKQVSGDLGFSTPSNFSTAFLRATGESPRAYRLRISRG